LIILTGGSIHYISDGPSLWGGISLFVVWGIMLKLIDRTSMFKFAKQKNKKSSDQEKSTDRLTHLEKQLADIQGIAVDEKLSRSEK
jgi:hypothetical protein